MDQQKAFGRITRRVAIDRSILTYRLAARELGCTVTDAKATLQAYFESDVAKERNVGAVWLVSGFLVPPPRAPVAPNGTQARDDDDAMDVDSSAEVGASAAAQGTQERGGAGEGGGVGKVVQRIVQRLVQNKDLEAQLPLFASTPRPPSTHLYALLPAPSLPDLALLGPAALSLVAPANRDKWRAPPAAEDEDKDAAQGTYGELVHPDGERRRVKGAAGRAAGAGASASMSAAKGKGKAPVAAAKKEDEDEDDKPVVADVGGNKAKGAKAKGADSKAKDKKASKKDADKDKDKAKAKGPTSRPIGQLGGLFSRKFDEPPPKKAKGNKGKGKGKAASSDSDSDSDGDASGASSDDDDEPAPPPKSKKVVPAKRKSSSPVVTRTKAVSSPAKAAAPNKTKKAPDVVLDGDDGDEFDDWAMDEEALLEAERAAEQQAATRKTSAGASASASGSAGAGKAKESKADRQKRELEEMMQSDDTMDIDSKPSRSNLSRTPSTSSAAPTKPKPKTSSSSSGGGTAQQKGLGAFFKKK
ncbi:hypothetical protein JCM9279_002660 [Rhodotorula babjevae]